MQKKKYNADLFVSMSFIQIFREEIMKFPKYKTINCHAGKLPFYRGGNTLNWALTNSEQEFVIAVRYIDNGIEIGDIILQETYPITDQDDYGTLLERAYDGCADILYRAVKMIQNNEVKVIKQSGYWKGSRRFLGKNRRHNAGDNGVYVFRESKSGRSFDKS